MSIENIKQLMDNLDISALLPDITDMLNTIVLLARIAMFAGPLLLLAFGLYYFLSAPKEANFTAGYRCYWGMGSEEAWQFTQRLAGILWMLAGLATMLGSALLNAGFHRLELTDMLWQIVRCLVYQGGIVLVLRLVIYVIVMCRYDRKGNRRLTWVQLWRGY